MARLLPRALSGLGHWIGKVPEGIVKGSHWGQKVTGEVSVSFFVRVVLPFPPVARFKIQKVSAGTIQSFVLSATFALLAFSKDVCSMKSFQARAGNESGLLVGIRSWWKLTEQSSVDYQKKKKKKIGTLPPSKDKDSPAIR